ncbi:scavenger receptor class F member 1-like isoform X2 [Mercenaria mercenaria]|uniref:scavenger receptor class F member 1-like isoform X2 n=1 Tax=Mercenaria mercenaria TaxID=6596 RepID=UPI00234F256B|nr:scavenger receptor class F member 1-like isoform X2 [Mercenaria mercenaria]
MDKEVKWRRRSLNMETRRITMILSSAVLSLLLCYFDVSSQACNECDCCEGDNACVAETKSCMNGCIAGFWGDKCINSCPKNCITCTSDIDCTECMSGFWGTQCTSSCGKGCVNNTCLQSGNCDCKSTNFDSGRCRSCIKGKFGVDCDESCPSNCGSCLSKTHCNWCKNRYYGSICQFECSVGCSTGTCKKNDGTCSSCKTGFTGNKCDSCITAKHGANCDLDCPRSCFCENECTSTCKSVKGKRSCNAYDGYCIYGCLDGFHGEMCDKKCSDKCVNATCLQTTAQCLYGCNEGFSGSQCTQAKKHVRQDGHTTSEMIGATFGAGLFGLLIGIVFTFVFITWKRRRNEKKGDEINGNPGDGIEIMATQDRDVDYENEMPATYEELKERDERTYSEITSNQQMSHQAAEYINC